MGFSLYKRILGVRTKYYHRAAAATVNPSTFLLAPVLRLFLMGKS